MLTKGNSKLGKLIWCFSIPAGSTCPGRSELCDTRCYAQRGFFAMPSVQQSQQRNFESTKLACFPEMMIEEIHKRKCSVVRIHVAGDYYSIGYVKKWYKIVKACPDVRFFTYTRSWRLDSMKGILDRFARNCHNLRMWYSTDQETGFPSKLPKKVRTAYMSIAMHDMPPAKSDLVFRDYPIRGIPQKYINGTLVCPPENGVNHLTCEKCGICWNRTTTPKREATETRIPLAVVTQCI